MGKQACGNFEGVTDGVNHAFLLSVRCCVAGLGPGELGFVAVHGTGTPLGDPIEVGALGKAISNRCATSKIMSCSSESSNHQEQAKSTVCFAGEVLVRPR